MSERDFMKEVFNIDPDYKFSANAQIVLAKRYLLRDSENNICESIDDLFRRVANYVAQAEALYSQDGTNKIEYYAKAFYELMINKEFLPNSPTLMNAGKKNGQLAACFVLPVPNNISGIFDSLKQAAIIHQTGGGTGFSFNNINPKSDCYQYNNSELLTGPIEIMKIFDAATNAIRQGGVRRGANMGILSVHHPDIMEFIECKNNLANLNNFNISVAITNEFIDALKTDSNFNLIHPQTKKIIGQLKASFVFQKLTDNAYLTGEPGLIFIDRINELDPLEKDINENNDIILGTQTIEATNPCGEQPLGPYDACNLGSINLTKFLDNNFNIDYPKLENAINLAVRFLDNVIDQNTYPLEIIKTTTKNNRRIGLGIMGFAEVLLLKNIPYNSQTALNLAHKFMQFFQTKAHLASSNLAKSRGVFPNWSYSKWAKVDKPMRNATVTTIAPTGTISIIADTTSGIEPLYALSYTRRVLNGQELTEVNKYFIDYAKRHDFYSEELIESVELEGSLANINSVPKNAKDLFVCAHDIAYDWHIKMQSVFQTYTDNAVSKTINISHDASPNTVYNAYMMAIDSNLKGITVYRDSARYSQVLNIAKTDKLKNNVSSISYSPQSINACFDCHP